MLATLLILVGLAGGGWWGWQATHGSAAASAKAPRTCVTPTPSPTPAAASTFVVNVLNSTPRQGLAHRVAAALATAGLRVGHVGNTKAAVPGTAVIGYGAGLAPAALTLAEHVPGASLAQVSRPGVTLVLGPDFRALAPAAAVARAHAADAAAAAPRPAVCTGP